MFKNAIKKNREYVKPIVHGYKLPYSDEVYGGIGSIMILNEDGWILTCKHIAQNIILADKIMEKYQEVKKDLIANEVPPKKIYKKHGISEETAVIFRNVFLNVVDTWTGMRVFMHKYLDMALIKFDNPGNIMCSKFPVFAKEDAEVGESLCRLGYPYPEINCFRYDHSLRDLIVKEGFDSNFQIFPLDGMLTRYLIDDEKKLSLFEYTNPSLIGQQGGPIINKEGYVVGLQIGSAGKDTGLDINTKVKRKTKEIEVKQYNFMNFGIGINVSTIKEFLKENEVEFKEEK